MHLLVLNPNIIIYNLRYNIGSTYISKYSNECCREYTKRGLYNFII